MADEPPIKAVKDRLYTLTIEMCKGLKAFSTIA